MNSCSLTLLLLLLFSSKIFLSRIHSWYFLVINNKPNIKSLIIVRRFTIMSSKYLIFTRLLSRRAMHMQVGQVFQPTNKKVGYWLVGLCGLTATTVSLGGITRLTKSGLSMVDWHPFNEFPPKGDAQWQQEFDKYKQYPEFKLRNSEITVQDFKWIWYMEYIHRTFGRAIGLSFFIPAGYFAYKGYIRGKNKLVVSLLGGLILFQGGLGWYMVKSGLQEKPIDYSEPRVSHLRLASHLGTAFLFFSATFLTAMHHLLPPESLTKCKQFLTLKRCSYGLTGAVFATALSGALVAGMEAGLTYNSWPKMADRWIPTDLWAKDPMWRNFLYNSTTVQFDHRWLGQLTFLLASGTWLYSRRLPLTPRLRIASNLVLAIACFQLSLGVTTLLLYVPKHLAATHQIGALSLLTSSLWLSHELKLIRK